MVGMMKAARNGCAYATVAIEYVYVHVYMAAEGDGFKKINSSTIIECGRASICMTNYSECNIYCKV